MNEITVQMTLKEAEAVCRILNKADPLGVFSGAVIKRVEAAARQAMTSEKEKQQIPLDRPS